MQGSDVGQSQRWTLDKPCPHTRTVPCPMPGSGQCNKDNLIYQATVTSGNDVETYVGCTTNSATKYYKHKTDCNNPKYKNGTTLSTYVCQYKMEDNRQGEPLQPHQQSVSSPYQGVLLYTFQEGHNILEQKRKSELFYNCVHKHSDLLMKV